MGLAHGKCPHCGNPLRVRESSHGHLRRCEWCGRKSKVNVRSRVSSGKAILFLLIAIGGVAIFFNTRKNNVPSPSGSSRPGATPLPQTASVNTTPNGTNVLGSASPHTPTGPPAKRVLGPALSRESIDQQVSRLTQARAKALQDLARAKADARSNFGRLPLHQAEAEKVAKLLAQLNDPHSSDTPREKLATSAAWNNARLAYERKSAAAVDGDQNVINAQQIFSDLNDELKDVALQQRR